MLAILHPDSERLKNNQLAVTKTGLVEIPEKWKNRFNHKEVSSLASEFNIDRNGNCFVLVKVNLNSSRENKIEFKVKVPYE